MSFLTSYEKYYRYKLSEFEGRKLNKTELYEVKQLLKLLDDIKDEGYTNLPNYLENNFNIITRLRNIISEHSETPFVIQPHMSVNQEYYDKKEIELEALCEKLIRNAKNKRKFSDNLFLRDINSYCDWIEYKTDTAYIFLLRDALLPFIYFKSRERTKLYPWLISRIFLSQVTEIDDIDDDIRLIIHEALENGITDFPYFKDFCKKRIYKIIFNHPILFNILNELLSEIHENKIMVIESGYCGTIPMILSSLDNRVDFKLYTTAPFLYNVYKEKIFCRKYENIRRFETLYSQDALMKYSSFKNRKFYVKIAQNSLIKDKSTSEVYSVIIKSNKK